MPVAALAMLVMLEPVAISTAAAVIVVSVAKLTASSVVLTLTPSCVTPPVRESAPVSVRAPVLGSAPLTRARIPALVAVKVPPLVVLAPASSVWLPVPAMVMPPAALVSRMPL